MSNIIISGIPKEPEMGSGHRNPFGQRYNFIWKKNGVLNLRKLVTEVI